MLQKHLFSKSCKLQKVTGILPASGWDKLCLQNMWWQATDVGSLLPSQGLARGLFGRSHSVNMYWWYTWINSWTDQSKGWLKDVKTIENHTVHLKNREPRSPPPFISIIWFLKQILFFRIVLGSQQKVWELPIFPCFHACITIPIINTPHQKGTLVNNR